MSKEIVAVESALDWLAGSEDLDSVDLGWLDAYSLFTATDVVEKLGLDLDSDEMTTLAGAFMASVVVGYQRGRLE